MKDVPENELFSAYLDGELTAAEQADVEQVLARSPAARQLLEELRALSSKLQALPQYKLGEDLSREVLRVAERRVLTQPAARGDLPRPAPPPRRAILRRLINSRALVWSSLAVAIAVILTVINRGPQNRPAEKGIARAPATEEKGGGAPETEVASKASQEPAESRFPVTEPVVRAATQDRGTAGAELADQPDGAKRPAEAGGLSHPAGEPQQPEDLVAKKSEPAQPAPGGPSPGQNVYRPGFGGRGGSANGTVGRFAAKGDAPQFGAGAAGYGMKSAGGAVADNGRDAGDMTQVAKGGQMTLAKALGEPGSGYAVVCCDLSPKAVQSQAFEHLLAVNGIALEWSAGRENGPTDTRLAVAGAAPDRRGQEQAEEQHEVPGVRLAAMPPVELDLVYVEATREQLQATLDAIDAQPGEFLSYSVEPAPGVEVQKDWGRQYRRGVEERVRRSGGLLAGKAEDTADAEAVVRAKAPALERQAAEGEAKDQSRAPAQGPSPQGTLPVPLPAGAAKGGFEAGTLLAGETQRGGLGTGTQQSLGRAWRLQVPGPALRGRLSASDEDDFALESGAAVQQAGPGAAVPDGPVVAEGVREKPPRAPVAEPKPEALVLTEKEGKSAIPGSQPTRNLAQTPSPPTPLTTGEAKREGPARSETPPAPAKPPAEPPAPAEQPAKSPDGGPRQDESLKAGSSGQAVGKVGVRGGAPKPKKGMILGAPGAPQAKAPPTQLVDKSLQGSQPAAPNVSPPPFLDQAEEKANEKSVSQQQRQQRQDFKQQPPVQTYRVLFVLRMAGPDVSRPPAAAASIMEQAEPPAARAPEGTSPAKKE